MITTTRMSFLKGMFATGAVTATSGCLFTRSASDFDERLTVLLSDIHVYAGGYQYDRFAATIAEILRMNPLPRRAVVMGDIAFLMGHKEDYLASAPFFKQLTDAGIEVTYCMGNHDRRKTFWEVHPEYRSRNLLDGRVVSCCSMPDADILTLDGLQGTDDRGHNDSGPVPGKLAKDMREWVVEELPKWKRPVFVASHFPVKELFIDKDGKQPLSKFMLTKCPMVRGYIHGHNHRWYEGFNAVDWSNPATLRCLCLPSTGHWGDIGYALFRTTSDCATASLVQKDFFYPKPIEKASERPAIWAKIVEDHRNLSVSFAI